MVMNVGLRPTMEACSHLGPHHGDGPVSHACLPYRCGVVPTG